MNSADRMIHVKAWRILTKPGNHARRPHECDAIHESKTSRPARKPCHGCKSASIDQANFTIPAIVNPKLLAIKASRMRSRQASCNDITRLARKNDSYARPGNLYVLDACSGCDHSTPRKSSHVASHPQQLNLAANSSVQIAVHPLSQ